MRALLWIFASLLAACSDTQSDPAVNERQPPVLQSPPECEGVFVKRADLNYPPEYRPQPGYVAATFNLEGTGHATSVGIVDSTLPESTNRAVVDMLGRSQFRHEVHAKGCSYVMWIRESRLW
jgi:hypothetical protein